VSSFWSGDENLHQSSTLLFLFCLKYTNAQVKFELLTFFIVKISWQMAFYHVVLGGRLVQYKGGKTKELVLFKNKVFFLKNIFIMNVLT
jgi:hypothetical protein